MADDRHDWCVRCGLRLFDPNREQPEHTDEQCDKYRAEIDRRFDELERTPRSLNWFRVGF